MDLTLRAEVDGEKNVAVARVFRDESGQVWVIPLRTDKIINTTIRGYNDMIRAFLKKEQEELEEVEESEEVEEGTE